MRKRTVKGNFRKSRISVRSLTWQTIVCILIILLIIAAKKMDSAVINRGVAFLERQLAEDYTISEVVDGAKKAASLLHAGNNGPSFIMPVDEAGVKLASAGKGSETVITFPADQELQVHASGGGTVSLVEPEGASGIRIEISHGNNMITEYYGCTDVYVKPLEKVKQGQIIASVVQEEGRELSFALRVSGRRVNPTEYMRD